MYVPRIPSNISCSSQARKEPTTSHQIVEYVCLPPELESEEEITAMITSSPQLSLTKSSKGFWVAWI